MWGVSKTAINEPRFQVFGSIAGVVILTLLFDVIWMKWKFLEKWEIWGSENITFSQLFFFFRFLDNIRHLLGLILFSHPFLYLILFSPLPAEFQQTKERKKETLIIVWSKFEKVEWLM